VTDNWLQSGGKNKSLGTAASVGPTAPVPDDVWSTGGNDKLLGKNQKTLCAPQIPNYIPRDDSCFDFPPGAFLSPSTLVA